LFDVVAGVTTNRMSEDTKLNKSIPVSDTTKVLDQEVKYTVSCGGQQQTNFFTGEVKVTLDSRMQDACLTFKPEAWKSKTGM
jgi:hypothetical protein